VRDGYYPSPPLCTTKPDHFQVHLQRKGNALIGVEDLRVPQKLARDWTLAWGNVAVELSSSDDTVDCVGYPQELARAWSWARDDVSVELSLSEDLVDCVGVRQ
jgi:hypothetical protein